MTDINRYLAKKHIDTDRILSVYCSGRQTIICCDSGEEFTSTLRLHELEEVLPEEKYISISRGILVRRDAILAISDEGVYTMIDGRSFQGRKRYLSAHKKLRKELGLNSFAVSSRYPRRGITLPMNLLEKCSVLDDMPVAYCIIELVFDENGHGIDFIFRYCNNQMSIVEGVPVEAMVNHSFYEVFKEGDKKWLISYADVALNGVQRTLHDYSPEIDKNLNIYCYQPEPGYCACVLVPDEN